MSKIFCTGSAGFICSNLVDRLIELGHEVIGIDDLSSGKIENINPKSKFINFDITNDFTLQQVREFHFQ
jgi:UDP-glucose 4-epimerase